MSTENHFFSKLMEEGFIDAAASKIHTKLEVLRGSSDGEKNKLRRRWVWELIQNANDSGREGVKVRIKTHNNILEFSHNGKLFSFKNLMDLVTQNSTKGITGDGVTGKFGTGFITTHLLSEKVRLVCKFVYDNNFNEEHYLDFIIDRSGKDIIQIKRNVELALEYLKNLSTLDDQNCEMFDEDFPTKFIYNLNGDASEILRIGGEDLDNSLMFVLAFAPKVESVTFNNVTYSIKSIGSVNNGSLRVVKIIRSDTVKQEQSEHLLLISTVDEVDTAVLIDKEHEEISIKPLSKITPRLFCKFPLVGTEDFSFPIIINSSRFKVEETRDGILEELPENKEIFMIAIEQYKKILQYVSQKQYHHIYNMCLMEKNTNSKLQQEMYDKLRDIFLFEKIVNVDNNNICLVTPYILDNAGKKQTSVLIPLCSNFNNSDTYWDLVNGMIGIRPIPLKNDFKQWAVAIPDCIFNFKSFCKWIEDLASIESLKQYFKDEANIFDWLNRLYYLAEKENILGEYKIVINQDQKFKKISELFIDNDIDLNLKEIIQSFGYNIKEELVSKEINLPEKLEVRSKSNREVANVIAQKIREELASENKSGLERKVQTQSVFNKITDWFLKDPKLAKELFLDIYDNRHLISSREETIRRLNLADKVEETLSKYNLPVDKLDEFLSQKNIELFSLFSEEGHDGLLISLAFSSMEELQKNNNIKEVKSYLEHNPSPSFEALAKVKSLIERSKINVIKYLSKFKNIYNCDDIQELAPTVFGGIEKYGQPIKIVVRPSDNDMIIIFFQSELEVLDDDNYELWIDNDTDDPRQLTFGDVLKTTGIRVIPLKNLFNKGS